jgi:hypothetical protein
MTIEVDRLGFLDVLKRGTSLYISTDHCNFQMYTRILDATPNGRGDVYLTFAGAWGEDVWDDGSITVTPDMIASALRDDDRKVWVTRHPELGGVNLVFNMPDDCDLPMDEERWRRMEEGREARLREQEG